MYVYIYIYIRMYGFNINDHWHRSKAIHTSFLSAGPPHADTAQLNVPLMWLGSVEYVLCMVLGF